MLSVGILTAPRPNNVSYLSESLSSYFQCWDIAPFIFQEPNSPKTRFDKMCHFCHNPHTFGVVNNFFAAVNSLLQLTATPYLMICEDDILWKNHAAQVCRLAMIDGLVGDHKMKDVGFFSPYCSKFNAYEQLVKNNPGWHQARKIGPTWCGNLAVIFPRKSAELFVEERDHYLTVADGFHADKALGEVFIKNNLKIVAHMPTLVHHLGVVSSNEGNNNAVNQFHEARLPADAEQWQ